MATKKRNRWITKHLAELRYQHNWLRKCVGHISNPTKYRGIQREVAREYARLRGWMEED